MKAQKYVSKPVEVDAFQFTQSSDAEDLLVILDTAVNLGACWYEPRTDSIRIMADSGATYDLEIGDWIVRRPNGSVSPVKAEYFPLKFTRLFK